MPAPLDALTGSFRRLPPHLRRSPIAVAVSGGADSVALLTLLRALPDAPELVVLHVDHGLRSDSGADAEFVRGLARDLDLPCRVHALWMAVPPGRSAETRARELRYRALATMAEAAGARVVATAHHQDDQVETVLFRLKRGTGIQGLCGIPELRVLAAPRPLLVWRPLLGVTRAALRAWLTERGQPYREDPSNQDRTPVRNRIRLDVLPGLRGEYGERVDEVILTLVHLADALSVPLRKYAEQLAGLALATPCPGRVVLEGPVPEVLREDLVALAMHYLDPEHPFIPKPRLLAECADLLAPGVPAGTRRGGRGGVVAERTRTGVILQQLPLPELPEPVAVDYLPQTVAWELPPLSLRLMASTSLARGTPADARIDLDRLQLPLELTATRRGDRFHPLGAPAPVRLRPWLAAHRVPRLDRDRYPVLRDATGQIVWVPGLAIAESVKLTSASRRAVRLRCAAGTGDA